MITEKLGAFAARLKFEDVPKDVVGALRLRILDQLGCALAGYSLGTLEPVLSVLEESGSSTVWGSGRKSSLRNATLANAFISHAAYMEDGSRYTGGHPACVVIPPVLTLAEARGGNGRDVLTAIAVGYEIFLRLGRALYPAMAKRGFASTGVLGGISAAAACSSLLRLSSTASANALAIGALTGVGFKEALKSMRIQPLQIARSVEGGLMSALLAEGGVAGAMEVIDSGFPKAFGERPDLAEIVRDLGREFRVNETYLKRHGGCRGNHAPVDIVERLMDENGIAQDEISSIEIYADSITLAPQSHIQSPTNSEQAQLSIPFAIASRLVLGDTSVKSFSHENLKDTLIQRVMSQITVSVDLSLDEGFPERRSAIAILTLKNGRSVRGKIDNAKGEPEDPLSADEIFTKFRMLARPQLGKSGAETLLAAIIGLEQSKDAGNISALMTAR